MRRWFGPVSIGAAFLLLVFIALRQISAADFWWQWKTGEYVAHHGFPRTDIFSYTMKGRPWIELRWLYCLLLYGLTQGLGAAGPILFRTAAVTAAFGLSTAAAATRRTLVPAAACAVLALLASSQRFYVRPELVTYAFFGLYIWIIERYRRRGGRAIYLLPFLQIIWTNAHTTSILGLVLAGIFWVDAAWRALRRWRTGGSAADAGPRAALATPTLVLAATLIAGFVNPYGLQGVLFPFQLFREIRGTIFKQEISEFRSPFSFHGYTALVYYKALITLCALSALANWRRLDPFRTLLAASQLFLSALAIRNLPLFALAAIPFILGNLRDMPVPRWRALRRSLPTLEGVLALAVLAAALGFSRDLATNRFNVRQGDMNRFGVGFASGYDPVDAVAYIRQHGLERAGHIAGTMRFSSYLIAQGIPVFMDPRLEVYGEAHFARLMRMLSDMDAWREAAAEFDIGVALLDVQAGFLRELHTAPDWQLLYFDDVAAVYARSDVPGLPRPIADEATFAEAVSRIRRELPQPAPWDSLSFFESATASLPYERLATFLLLYGQTRLAEPFLVDALRAYPDLPDMLFGYGRLLQGRGDVVGAMRLFRRAREIAPDDPVLMVTVSRIDLDAGRVAEARSVLEELVKKYPEGALGWALLGRACAAAGDLDRAAEATARAVTLDPANAQYRVNLATVETARGDSRAAIGSLRDALEADSSSWAAHRDLARLLMAQGKRKEASEHVSLGLQLRPEDPELRSMAEELGVR